MINRKPYIEQQNANWWTENPAYRRYMLRECTSIFALIYALILLWGLFALSNGESAFIGWLETMANPGMVVVHIIGLISTLFHTVTWFELTPKIMYLYRGETRVPENRVKASQYVVFVLVTITMLVLAVIWL